LRTGRVGLRSAGGDPARNDRARDLDASIEFYRRLGLEVPDLANGRPITVHRMGSGMSLLLTTGFASRYDPNFERPAGGYQQLLEFFVGEDAKERSTLTGFGYHARMPPTKTAGPYAAMVDEADGNVVLLTSDEAADPENTQR
jgi:catechol 2,3-dioxygenase-like lactoylglutathione lyase family enzyme